MEKLKEKSFLLKLIGGCAGFLAILILMSLTPLTGDDWFFLNRHTTELSGLAATISEQWHNLNGRVLGNICAILFSGLDFAREFVKAAVVFLTILFLNRLIFPKHPQSLWTGLLIGAAVYMMPREMYRQTYNWMAGFFNYVPVMLFVLLYLWLIRDFLAGDAVKSTPFSVLSAAVLGVCSQLFAENLTIFVTVMSISMVVWYWVSRKKLSLTMTAYAACSIIGALIMFLSPVYSRISADEDGYRTMNLGVWGLLEMFAQNYETVIWYAFRAYLPILVLAAALCCVLLSRNRRMHPAVRYLLMGCACLGPVYGFMTNEVLAKPRNNIFKPAIWLDLAVWVLFGVSILLTLLTSMESVCRRRLGLVFLWGIPLSAGPLLFVQPIGPRCFYLTYICLLGVLFVLFAETVNWEALDKAKVGLLRFAALFLAGAGFLFYFQVSFANHETFAARTESAREQVTSGDTVIILPQYPYPEFVHDTDPQKMEYIYRDTYGSLTFLEQ